MVSKDSAALPRYQRAVEGLVLPVPVASHLALDFCNTLAGWNGPQQREYLVTYDHLVVWAREAGLVDGASAASLQERAAKDAPAARRELERARSLREHLYAACTDTSDRPAWEAVARYVRSAAAHSLLHAAEAPGRRWSISTGTGLSRPVLEVARVSGELLATVELEHVRACRGTGCGWLFIDPSGRRRWCTMAVCGNRAKARRHADRTRSGSRAGQARD
jgi:predicted RNA-binding Zn ribbon-like protein